MGRITVKEQDTQDTPTTGYVKIYPKTDGKWYSKNDAGTETELGAGGTPDAHASTHKGDGLDPIAVATTSVDGLMDSADKTKLNGVATGADVTGSNAPQAHKTLHQNGGGDELSVAGLSGVLADEQDAGWLKGLEISSTAFTNGSYPYYNLSTGKIEPSKINIQAYKNAIAKDWAPTAAELEAWGPIIFFNTNISLTGVVGNATVATVNGLTPTAGDAYIMTDAGTLTLGSVGVAAGFVVVYTGAAWAIAAPSATGYVLPDIRVQLSTTTALVSPYTDGTDDGKIVAFDGTDNTGEFTDGPCVLTLPAPTDFPNDDMFRGPFYVGNFGGTFPVKIQPASAGTFSDGLTELWLEHAEDAAILGTVNGDLAQVWARVNKQYDVLQIRRAATWSATNFATASAIPFDTQDASGNTEVNSWSSTVNPSRVTFGFGGTYEVGGFVSIDSTGGSTWNLESYLTLNGTEVPGTRIRTGNYGGEDGAITLPKMTMMTDSGDYLEWVLDHTSLTGNLVNCTMVVTVDY